MMTSAKKNDRSQMENLIDEVGITYVFDRGYIDYEKFDDYCERGIFFVTRSKRIPLFVSHILLLAKGQSGSIRSDGVYRNTVKANGERAEAHSNRRLGRQSNLHLNQPI